MAPKIDATRPFYVVVGVGDLAVEYARTAATDVQTRFAKVELEPKALRDQAMSVFNTRVEELTTEAKGAQGKLEGRFTKAQKDLEGRFTKAQKELEERVKEIQ